MDQVFDIISKLPEYVAAVNGILLALIVFFTLIPGDQPEKTLIKIVNLISKVSRKKK